MNLVERVHGVYGGARRMRALCDHVVDMIPRRATLLDVGCGDGLLAERIETLRDDVTVRGVDVLVRPGAKIPVLEYDGLSIPYPDDSFDFKRKRSTKSSNGPVRRFRRRRAVATEPT